MIRESIARMCAAFKRAMPVSGRAHRAMRESLFAQLKSTRNGVAEAVLRAGLASKLENDRLRNELKSMKAESDPESELREAVRADVRESMDLCVKAIAEHLARVEAGKIVDKMLEWTTTPPTKPGWYWWRENSDRALIDLVRVKFVDDPGTFTELQGYWTCWYEENGFLPLEDMPGEWWPAPVEPPE